MNHREPYPFHKDLDAPTYTAEHVARIVATRERNAERQRKARRVERFYMIATLAGIAAVAVAMFHHLTK